MADRIRVGVWGLGRAGNGMHFHELGLYPDLYEVVAGCDIDVERREAAVKKIPSLHVYDNSADFLKNPDIELVTIATRSPDHVKHAIEAAEAGKYVMVEKPIACTYADALKLKEASERFPGKIFIRHNRRFEPAFAHIREIIATGKLGTIFEIKLCRHSFQWRADWQTILSEGGGQLLNWGPHLVRGSRGSLVSYDEKKLKLKYLNPAIPLPEIHATSANPPLDGGFGGQVSPVWVEDELGVAPSSGDTTEKIWYYLYQTIRNHAAYPITMEQAVEVVRVIDQVKQGAIDVVK